MAIMTDEKCPICAGVIKILDAVDFNKSCEHANGKHFPPSGRLIHYYQFLKCFFAFAPEFKNWSDDEFIQKIYNDQYTEIDPEYNTIRPVNNALFINQLFGNHKKDIRHLDYGGGNGKLSSILRDDGWDSFSYDPFPNQDHGSLETLGQYDFITAFEVFEHVPDIGKLISNLKHLMKPSCLIIFSTLISDGHIKDTEKLTWWYASPRNGHISLFSKRSLHVLAQKNRLFLGSFSAGKHFLFNTLPDWSKKVIALK